MKSGLNNLSTNNGVKETLNRNKKPAYILAGFLFLPQFYFGVKALLLTDCQDYAEGQLLLISKIPHFESNSQLFILNSKAESRCYWYQRYLILKAIHNTDYLLYICIGVVTDIKDTSFWKQFTTGSLATQ